MFSCNNDDDDTEEFQPRDPVEVEAENRAALEEYLATHFYNYEDFQNPPADFDYVVRFDTINEANADKIPLIQSPLLEEKTVTRDDIDYTLYILKVREGEGEQPTFADSTFVSHRGSFLNRNSFDSAVTPVWFDLPGWQVRNAQGRVVRVGGTVVGMAEALIEFRAASDFDVASDNSVEWSNDYGIGAVLMPSGLGYGALPPTGSGIPAYSPLVFSFQLLWKNEADHDGDGIPSYMEDLNGDGNLFNDDTDGNGLANSSDPDDDGDRIPTRDEINIEEDGTLTFPDTNGNGVLDYLDPTV